MFFFHYYDSGVCVRESGHVVGGQLDRTGSQLLLLLGFKSWNSGQMWATSISRAECSLQSPWCHFCWWTVPRNTVKGKARKRKPLDLQVPEWFSTVFRTPWNGVCEKEWARPPSLTSSPNPTEPLNKWGQIKMCLRLKKRDSLLMYMIYAISIY